MWSVRRRWPLAGELTVRVSALTLKIAAVTAMSVGKVLGSRPPFRRREVSRWERPIPVNAADSSRPKADNPFRENRSV